MMMKDEFRTFLIKLVSGEELIGECQVGSWLNPSKWDYENNDVVCKHLCKLLITSDPLSGASDLVLLKYPYFSDLKDEFTKIKPSAIAYLREPLKEMVDFYVATYTHIHPEDEENIKGALKFATKKILKNVSDSKQQQKQKKAPSAKDIH